MIIYDGVICGDSDQIVDDIFYIDVDNSSLRKKAEEFLGRKIHVSVGYFGILENMK